MSAITTQPITTGRFILRPQEDTGEPIILDKVNPRVELKPGYVEVTDSNLLRFISPRCLACVTVSGRKVGNKSLSPGDILGLPDGKSYTIEAA